MTPDVAWKAWHGDPSEDNREALFKSLGPTVMSALKSYAGDDKSLAVRAFILTDEAIRSYDPSRGAAVRTHVMTHLQRLKRINSDRKQVVRVPENRRLESGLIRKYVSEYTDKHGYEPSQQHLADKFGISRKRVSKAVLQLSSGEMSESTTFGEKGDVLSSDEGLTSEDILSDYVYQDLDERGRKIFEWSTGYGGAEVLPGTDIAKRLKMTPSAVSQRLKLMRNKFEGFERYGGTDIL